MGCHTPVRSCLQLPLIQGDPLPDVDLCPRARRARTAAAAAVLAVLLSLFASFLTLTGASPAAAADAQCAPLALASFGDPGAAVGTATVPPEDSACFTVTAPAAGLYLVSLKDRANAYTQMYAEDGTEVDCYDERFSESGRCQVSTPGSYTVKIVNNGWGSWRTLPSPSSRSPRPPRAAPSRPAPPGTSPR